MRLILKPNYQFALEMQKAVPRRFQSRQPNRQKLFTRDDKDIQYTPWQALKLIRAHSFCSFDETIDICLHLGVNPKHGDQMVRGSAFMPAGLGKQTKICVLCPPEIKDQLKAKGVDYFFDQDILNNIKNGTIQIDMMFSTPDLIPQMKAHGKILGPRGLMPNSKTGTLLLPDDLVQGIQKAKAGQVNYRVDAGKNLHAQIGKISFTDQQLLINFKALMKSIVDSKPKTVKRRFIRGAFIKSTMGPRWRMCPYEIDPKDKKTIWDLVA